MRTPTKDYYKILRVSESADETEIKKSYRKLAMEYHPDHNPGDRHAEEKFKEITEAYGVLMDPVKRQEYDRFRSGFYAGADSSSQFRYSQKDIFESMFQQAFGRDIFSELNKEFAQYGYRTGNTFFETVFFGGTVSGFGRFLTMIPGPLGRLGYVIRLLQMVGSSVLLLNRMAKKTAGPLPEAKPEPSILGSIKSFLRLPNISKINEETLNIEMAIPVSLEEARYGAKKKIAYKAGDLSEKLQITIPPATTDGGKLRIKGKGLQKDDLRGDLILLVQVKP